MAWKFGKYTFDTKLEMECFARGYLAAKAESKRQQRRNDEIRILYPTLHTVDTQEISRPIDYPPECGIEARLIFDEI